MRKLLFVVGLGAGYVLGARAGREQYDKIAAAANNVWQSPKVAKARKDVEAYARQQAPIIAEKAEAAVKAAPAVIADSAHKTADAAKEAADRAAGIAKDVADRTSVIAKDVAGRTTVVAKDVAGRTTVVAKDVAGRTTVVAKDVAGRTTIIAKDVAGKVSDTADDLKTRIDPKKPAELKVEPDPVTPADNDLA
jgi:hypothetical protein